MGAFPCECALVSVSKRTWRSTGVCRVSQDPLKTVVHLPLSCDNLDRWNEGPSITEETVNLTILTFASRLPL